MSGRSLLPLLVDSDRVAPARPVVTPPARRPGSVRRSSRVDMSWPEGVPGDPSAPLVLEASARDVVTSLDGTGRVVGQADLHTSLEPGRRVTGVTASPDPGGLEQLVGLRAASGWRAAARQLVPDGLLSPLGLLLDEVPIAVLLSFYGALRAGTLGDSVHGGAYATHMRDLCAGWATDATPMRSLDSGAGLPMPLLVPVPRDTGDDPLATEPRPALAPGRLRRTRRIDVVPGEVVEVQATFRDSWCDPVDGEGILHEYVLVAQVDAAGLILTIAAEPRVLPYPECPSAAAAAQHLVGLHVATAATTMPTALGGPSSCTHLNDLMRSLACVPRLAALGSPNAEETKPLRQ